VSTVHLVRSPAADPGEPAMHDAIAQALGVLDGAGIRWCLLRGAQELDLVDGDVDLLVSRSELGRLRHRLVASGGLSPLSSWGRRPHSFYVGPVAGEDDAVLKLDVVDELAFGPYGELPTGAADQVLAGRRRHGDLWLPAPADAFWSLLLHALMDKGRVREERALELVALAPAARDERSALRDVVDAACPGGWGSARVLDAVEHRAWDELLALAPLLRDRWPGTTRARRAGRVAARRLLRKASRLQQRGSMTSNRRPRSTG
jgi:hypothetical protein